MSCGCGKATPAFALGSDGSVPAPRTPGLTVGGALEPTKSKYKPIIVALVVVGLVVLIAAVMRKKKTTRSRFCTLYNCEEPTRSYTPYTGTIPFGTWGTLPWAEAFDLDEPSIEYYYLPPVYRYPIDVL